MKVWESEDKIKEEDSIKATERRERERCSQKREGKVNRNDGKEREKWGGMR